MTRENGRQKVHSFRHNLSGKTDARATSSAKKKMKGRKRGGKGMTLLEGAAAEQSFKKN